MEENKEETKKLHEKNTKKMLKAGLITEKEAEERMQEKEEESEPSN